MHRLPIKTTAVAIATALSCALASSALLASSHREAPFITELSKVDGTDFYMFRSYEDGRQDFVTLIANYQPLQDSYGGPNYFTMDPNALYEIHIDNNGDAVEDITFQFRFSTGYRNAFVTVGDNEVKVPIALANVGPLGNTADVGPGVEDNAGLNVIENYQLTVVRGDRRSAQEPTPVVSRSPLTGDTSSTVFRKPVDNIGQKTISDYPTYAGNHIFDIDLSSALPGCTTDGRVFVGQRREGFVVNLGEVFDRINNNGTNAPLAPGYARSAGTNIINDKNITSLALEIPTACLLQSTAEPDPVIGGWTTASLRQARVLNPVPLAPSQVDGELNTPAVEGGPWTQVSRLGSPLVNEVIIGLNSKDRFNASEPPGDLNQFALFVTHPTLPTLIEALFAVTAPPTPRTDLVAAFVTGIRTNINGTDTNFTQPRAISDGGGQAGEMLRLNTALGITPVANQSDLGFLACDLGGFPNGRRPVDDVVDIALTVAEGAIKADDPATDVNESNPNRLQTCDVSGADPVVVNEGRVVTDGARPNPNDYLTAFPYLNNPLPGSPISASGPTQ